MAAHNSLFFEIGCHRHHRYAGGLADHSLGVYDAALANNRACDINSIIITALLHDLGDLQYKNFHGHGRKSVAILADLKFELKPEEYRAIRFHMSHRPSVEHQTELHEFEMARQEPLWVLLHMCDIIDASGGKAVEKILKLKGRYKNLVALQSGDLKPRPTFDKFYFNSFSASVNHETLR